MPADATDRDVVPIRAEKRARLLEAIAKARRWLEELVSGRSRSTKDVAGREGCSERSVRMTLSLAFLSPQIVQAAVDGTLVDGPGVSRLMELSECWREQVALVGTSGS